MNRYRPPGHTQDPVPYIPDGSPVLLSDGTTGHVKGDLGGENAPVYLTGHPPHPTGRDHVYVPRDQITVLSNPDATLTFHRDGGCNQVGCCEEFWAQCDDCGEQLHLTEYETPWSDINTFRTTHPCAPQGPDHA